MLINVDLKTCSKYIHANEITLTKRNSVLDTSLLSEKGKRLFVELFANNYFVSVPTVDYQAFINADDEDPVDPVDPVDPEPPVVVPATYSILKSGKTLTLTFSEPAKINGTLLESYEGSGVDFIKASAIPKKDLNVFDQAIDASKVSLVTTSTSAVLTLNDDFFVKSIFKMLDDSATNEIDVWDGNDDGIYRAKYDVNTAAFATLEGGSFTAPASVEVTVTAYTSASETVEVHTAQDYADSTIYGVFDDTLVYPE